VVGERQSSHDESFKEEESILKRVEVKKSRRVS
jgi:hypothetical protein